MNNRNEALKWWEFETTYEQKEELIKKHYSAERLKTGIKGIEIEAIFNAEHTNITKQEESLRDGYEKYLTTDDTEMRRMYGHHLRSYEAGAIWQASKDKETIKALVGGLNKFLSVINKSDAALYHYGDAINNAEQLIQSLEKENTL